MSISGHKVSVLHQKNNVKKNPVKQPSTHVTFKFHRLLQSGTLLNQARSNYLKNLLYSTYYTYIFRVLYIKCHRKKTHKTD